MHSVNLTVQRHHEITCMRGWMEAQYSHGRNTVYPCQSAGGARGGKGLLFDREMTILFMNSPAFLYKQTRVSLFVTGTAKRAGGGEGQD
jgi:hypothetical protein